MVSLDGIPIKHVTRVQTLCEVFKQRQSLKTFLTEVVQKLLKLYVTIPATTDSSENNFSTLKNLSQEFYRSAMSKPLYSIPY